MPSARIHHLTTASELRAGCTASHYAPARLPHDGFVHCSGSLAVTLAVARDYFFAPAPDPEAGPAREAVYVLVLDPDALTAPLRFEAPAPLPGGGRAHLATEERFPHVYGPIDRAAIVAVGELAPTDDGFTWPERFESLEAVLSRG